MLEEKLRALENQYAELEARLAAPETYADPARVAQLNREQRELEPVVTAYRAYERRKRDLADAEALLSDPDMKELAQEEYTEAKADVARLEEEIRVLLLPRDPNDGKNVIVEIRAGVGGEEAALFANSLYRMYAMYAEARRWNVEVTSLSDTELGGIKEICFTIDGEEAYSRLKFESGVHRVQRVPETESGGRIHTSTVTVAVLPEVDEVDFALPRRYRDAGLPGVRRGGAACEQNLLRRAAHPQTHRHGGGVPAGAQPVPKQGQSHAAASIPALRGEGAGTGGGPYGGAPQPGGHRDAQRAHPHLQFPPGTGHRSPHWPHAVQDRCDHERRSGRGHRRAGHRRPGGTDEAGRGRGIKAAAPSNEKGEITVELCIHFNTLPEGMSLDDVKSDLAVLLEEDGWLTGSAQSPAGGYIELELEDEKANPKYGILTVKGYLQKAKFAPETTIELAGVPVGIYE